MTTSLHLCDEITSPTCPKKCLLHAGLAMIGNIGFLLPPFSFCCLVCITYKDFSLTTMCSNADAINCQMGQEFVTVRQHGMSAWWPLLAQYWPYYPGALTWSQVTATHLKIGNQWILSSDAPSLNELKIFDYMPGYQNSSIRIGRQVGTSNGSWCMGIKGEMSGTVCVTFTWYMYIYELFIAFVCFVVCSLL